MADYNSSYTGPQIDEAVGKALTPDATPTENSTELVQSGGAYADVRTRVPNYGKGKNLLRNWYFVGGGTGRGVFPVNQRGFASSSGINNIYSIDGWYINGGRGEQALQSNGFYINNNSGTGNLTVQQSIDMRATDYKGKSVTLSVLVDGNLYHESKTVPQQSSSLQTVIDLSLRGPYCRLYLLATDSSAPFVVQFLAGNSRTALIQAVKLELGTEQTLAHQENGVWVLNDVPDYEYELYRCMTSTADPSDTYANKSLATRQDLTSIQATGTTNTTGAAIPAGAYFYLNGVLHRAKVQIDQNATFTVNTNCEQVTGGGLNDQVIGERILLNGISVANVGDYYEDFTALPIPIGYERCGYITTAASVRLFVLGVGGTRCYYKVVSTASTATSISLYPVYKRL